MCGPFSWLLLGRGGTVPRLPFAPLGDVVLKGWLLWGFSVPSVLFWGASPLDWIQGRRPSLLPAPIPGFGKGEMMWSTLA